MRAYVGECVHVQIVKPRGTSALAVRARRFVAYLGHVTAPHGTSAFVERGGEVAPWRQHGLRVVKPGDYLQATDSGPHEDETDGVRHKPAADLGHDPHARDDAEKNAQRQEADLLRGRVDSVPGMPGIVPGGGRVGSTVQPTGGGHEGPAAVPARPSRGAGLRARHVGEIVVDPAFGRTQDRGDGRGGEESEEERKGRQDDTGPAA